MEVRGKFHDPATLPPRMSHRYPLNGRLSVPQSRSGRFVEEKNLLSLPVFEVRIVHYTNYVIPTIHMCTHTHTHTHTHTYIYIYMCVCVCVYIYIHEVEGQYIIQLL